MNDTKVPLPLAHRLKEEESKAYFEDYSVGQLFYIPSRTQTEAIFAAFQTVSGDNRPSHYNVEYCRALGFPNMMAHGMQILAATAPGASDYPHNSGYGIIGLSASFKQPVFCGDTIYPQLEVVELRPNRSTGVVVLRNTVHNQRGELCMEGRIELLLRKRNPDPG